MGKQEFLDRLKKGLSGLPKKELAERLSFYSEMIDDRMEEGLSETEAVVAVGTVEQITAQILADMPPKKAKKGHKTGWILALIFGAPVWLSLLAVALSLCASIWAIVVSLWVVAVAVACGAVGSFFSGVAHVCQGNYLGGLAWIGVAIFCVGLAIFMLFVCKWTIKGAVFLTKAPFRAMKKRRAKKEVV